jgi:hypothetical protein
MSALQRSRRLATTLGIATTAVLIGVTAAPAEVGSAALKKISPSGVGGVKIGRTYASLRKAHLVGKIRKGCPLNQNTRGAALAKPLKGSVDFSLNSKRKVNTITVTGGAAAKGGVGFGATIARIQAAYPKSKVNHLQDKEFGVTFVNVPRSGGGPLQFAVSVKTKKVNAIGIPYIATCE